MSTAAQPAETPVFVDTTGRRRRRIRRTAIGLSIAACAYGVMLVVSLLGGPVPPHVLLPLPGNQNGPVSAGKATAGNARSTASVHVGIGSTAPAPGSGATPAASRSAASPILTPSPSASPSASRHQPRGLASKTSSPGAGHSH